MNPSLAYGSNDSIARVKKETSKYTKHYILDILGHQLLQTNYEFDPANCAQKFFADGCLSDSGKQAMNGKAAESMTHDDWIEVAKADGLPDLIPTSLWAKDSIAKQRKVLSEAIYSQKLIDNLHVILSAFEASKAGNYTAPLLEGVPGSSKTYSVQVAAALLGRPYMEIRGNASMSNDVDRHELWGGPATLESSRSETARQQMYHGMFRKTASQASYYREIQKLISSGKSSSFEQAHSMLDEASLNRIADADGIPDSGISFEKFGMSEIARRNGAIVLWDEVNSFHPTKHPALEKFNSPEHAGTNSLNTVYAFTCNPPIAQNGARFDLPFPFLSRCSRRTVHGLSKDEYSQMISSTLGYAALPNIVIDNRQIPVTEVIEQYASSLVAKGVIKAHEKDSYLPKSGSTIALAGVLSPNAVTAISERLAAFHSDIEAGTQMNGELNSASYGLEQTPDVCTLRQLDKFMVRWSNKVFNKMVRNGKLSPEVLAAGEGTLKDAMQSKANKDDVWSAFSDAIEECYSNAYNYVSTEERMDGKPSKSKDIIEAKIKAHKLTPGDVNKLELNTFDNAANTLYESIARKLDFNISGNAVEVKKFAETLRQSGIDITNKTYRNFVAVTMPDGTKQILCLKETPGTDMSPGIISTASANTKIKPEKAAVTLPLRGSVFQSVITQYFASIPEKDGVKIPDQKPNQCLVFVGANKDGADVTATILAQVCTYEKGKKPEAAQLDWNGADASLQNVKTWLTQGASNGEWKNPSKDKLPGHKQLEVKLIELDKVVRIEKTGGEYRSVTPQSLVEAMESMEAPANSGKTPKGGLER